MRDVYLENLMFAVTDLRSKYLRLSELLLLLLLSLLKHVRNLNFFVTTDQRNIAVQCLSGFNLWTVAAVACTFNIYLIYTFFTASRSLLFRMINCLPAH